MMRKKKRQKRDEKRQKVPLGPAFDIHLNMKVLSIKLSQLSAWKGDRGMSTLASGGCKCVVKGRGCTPYWGLGQPFSLFR